MAKPNKKTSLPSGLKDVVSPSRSTNKLIFLNSISERTLLFLLLAITFICFFPSLQNKFVNLDDTQYVLNNSVLKNISSENIKLIFTEQFVGNYQPLTMLSYMFDYKIFALSPFGYHLSNLLFHLLSTLLTFFIIKKLSNNVWVSFLTSLLFGIHPLHVESVAWVSERKDVLYGFFFLASLYLYLLHAKQEKQFGKYFMFSLLFFVCSVLSKAQAVVLPVVFFMVDFLIKRFFTKKTILEKIPFFIIAFAFGILAIKVQGKAGAMQTFQYFPFYERLLFSCYALMTYLHKLILPINLSCFYPYPETNDKINTVWVYLSPLILLTFAFMVWKYFKQSKVVLFGIGFFLLTIILVLQLLPIGDALYADRYTYIPSIGIFFIASHFIELHFKKNIVLFISGTYLLMLCYFTFQRTKIWHDSIVLYTNAIDNGYKAAILYNNRGAVLTDSSDNKSALKDFTSLVELKPRYPNGWRNKGLVHQRLKQNEEAIKSFSEAIQYFPDDYNNYLSRGAEYMQKNNFDAAIKDFTKIIELQTNSGEGYYARSEAYGKSGKLKEALQDINKAIELSPNNGQAFNNRGIIFSMNGNFREAINDFTKSLLLKPDNFGAYTNRSLAYKGIGQFSEALKDLITAKEKGVRVEEDEINKLTRLANGEK